MKRMHVHVAVANLAESVRFYSTLFGINPTVSKDDYAKWMLEDPRVNFAISCRGQSPGLDHLGIQVDDDEELGAVRERLDRAALPGQEQAAIACCYARSDKYWITDPQGIPWESFHTLSTIPTFNGEQNAGETVCCSPASRRSRR